MKEERLMHNNNPRVSVIIPVFNREVYLAAAIESVLAQTYRSVEIIVLDDGSTDNSRIIAESYIPEIRYQYQPNGGIGAALHQGVKLATCDFIAFLDSDDLWLCDKLEMQMNFLAEHPKIDAVFGQIEQFYSPDMSPDLRKKYGYHKKVISAICTDTMLIRRVSFFRVGTFKPALRSGAFIDWFTRAKDADLHFEILPKVMAKRRIHDTNYGIQNRALQHGEYTRILKDAIDRRRILKNDKR
jgi:glycosyltransferase involved in cell wall biosynthesis